ncbi:hypothetical protein IFM89_038461 [Coptis chinensis]|uniref:CCHC-type domain-containing protein n=1 Tax=Coptis chinensis TaxID=261450 RepID=A0A835HB94_9MAGN|nr:hypothetical protein IFM89_038461 [Coptis chinensis]
MDPHLESTGEAYVIDIDDETIHVEEEIEFQSQSEDTHDIGANDVDVDKDRCFDMSNGVGPYMTQETCYVSEKESDEEDEDWDYDEEEASDDDISKLELVSEGEMDVDIQIDEFVKSTRNLYEAEDNERIEDPALGTTNFSLTKGDKNNKNVQAKAPWVANELEDFARAHPTFAPVDLHNEIYNEYGVLISYWTTWRTRVLLLERINAKAYMISTHEICMETLEHDEKNAKIWLEKQPKRTWARAYFDLTSKCDAVTSNFSESFNAWILKIRDKPLFQFVDKYTLSVMALMHDRRELGLELTDGDLVPVVTDVIKRYCSHYYTVESFRATYAGYIYPVANQDDWDKIKPTNVVLPPPNNRNPGRPRKQRIRGRDEEKSSGKRKCRRCGQVGHNIGTCKQEGGETSSAPPNNIGSMLMSLSLFRVHASVFVFV